MKYEETSIGLRPKNKTTTNERTQRLYIVTKYINNARLRSRFSCRNHNIVMEKYLLKN